MVVDGLLTFTALSCWAGALGMIRMRDAYQALHYLGVPAIVGMGALTVAVWVETGWTQATCKCGMILVILVASNSVGTHAAARAFRQREKGHWRPLPEDKEIEFLRGGRE
jgi:monovalent cation/proton antiporter MnhG/PhaG subunit